MNAGNQLIVAPDALVTDEGALPDHFSRHSGLVLRCACHDVCDFALGAPTEGAAEPESLHLRNHRPLLIEHLLAVRNDLVY